MSDGRWKAVLSLGRTFSGKRIRRSRICKSHADARSALDELRSGGRPKQLSAVLTVGDFLAKWLADSVQPKRAENTHASYRFACETHLGPAIGNVPLAALTALDVESAMSSLRRAGVGSRTIQNAFVVLRAAMNQAVKFQLITSNPCQSVECPSHDQKKIWPFTVEQSQQLLSATGGERYGGLYQLALSTGMRQGELFGLEWESVDLRKNTLHVVRQATEVGGKIVVRKPKTAAGVRTINLTPQAATVLKELRGLKVSAPGLVFPAPRGGYLRSTTFRFREWMPLLVRLKLDHRGFHHLRHTYATLALGAGVPVHVVSKILGHSQVSTTMEIYAHAMPADHSAATNAIAKLLG